jgi:hypothetical protein
MVFINYQYITKHDKYCTNYQHLDLYDVCKTIIPSTLSVSYNNLKDTDIGIFVFSLRESCDYTINSICNLQELIQPSIIERAKNGKALLILCQSHEFHPLCANTVHKLCLLLEEYKVPLQNVIILTNTCTRVPEVKFFNKIRCYGFNYFELAVKYLHKSNCLSSGRADRILNIANDNLMHRFLCLNRQPKDFRYEIVYKLWKKDILKNTLCSLLSYNNNDIQTINPHTKQLFLQDDFKSFSKLLPLSADGVRLDRNQWDTCNNSFIKNCGINLITETLVEPTITGNVFFTEKIFKSIFYTMPFVVVSQPYFLYNLKLCGYKTYSSLWCEEYDQHHNWLKRCDTIIGLMDYLNTLTNIEFLKILKNSIPINNHNFLHLISANADIAVAHYLEAAYNNIRKY